MLKYNGTLLTIFTIISKYFKSIPKGAAKNININSLKIS